MGLRAKVSFVAYRSFALALLLLSSTANLVHSRRDVWKALGEDWKSSEDSFSQTLNYLGKSARSSPGRTQTLVSFEGSSRELVERALRLPGAVRLYEDVSKHVTELASRKVATNSLQAFTADPTPPSLPEQFTADILLSGPIHENSTMYYDGISMRSRQDGTIKVSFGDPSKVFELASESYTSTSGQEYVQNGVCRKVPGEKFYDFWIFVKYSTYAGKALKLGKLCDVWNFESEKYNVTIFVNDHLPVSMNSSSFSSTLPGTKPRVFKVTQDFYNVQVGEPQVSLDPPETCLHRPPLCNSSQTVSKIVVYVAHPKGLYNLSNQDVADSLGDVTFTCYDVVNNNTQTDNYGVVSLYVLEVDTRWGAYSLCNGYNPAVCFGTETFYVGREASFGVTKNLGGQCTDNRKTGNWYSLPHDGQCQGSDTVKSGKCSWRIIERVKTVDLDCVFKTHGMLGACARDGTLPFAESQGIFLGAFQNTDEAEGGCTDLGGPYSL